MITEGLETLSQGVCAARKCLWESVLDETVLSYPTAPLLFSNSTRGSPVAIETAMASMADPGGMRQWELLSSQWLRAALGRSLGVHSSAAELQQES